MLLIDTLSNDIGILNWKERAVISQTFCSLYYFQYFTFMQLFGIESIDPL
jgi:hypothetical protein